MGNDKQDPEVKVTIEHGSTRLVVFLVSSISSASEPWRTLPDSDVFGNAGVVFVKIAIGHWSLMKPIHVLIEFLSRICDKYSSDYPDSEYAIVCWGIGGVAVKRLLIDEQRDGWVRRLKLVAFIGTPGRRSPSLAERLIPSWLRSLGSSGLRGFDLDELGYKWENFVRQVTFRVVYIVGSYDSVAPFSASDQWDSSNLFVIPETHVGLVTGAALESGDSSLSTVLTRLLLEQVWKPKLV